MTSEMRVLVPESNFGSTFPRRTFADRARTPPKPGNLSLRCSGGNSGATAPVALDRRELFIEESSYATADALFGQLASEHPQLVFVGDTLQRLDDPRPLLRTLRRVAQLNPHNRVVVTAFDPSASAGDDGRNASWAQSACLRLWTRGEMIAFLEACGFDIVAERPRPARADAEEISNNEFVLASSEAAYRRHLEIHGHPSPTVEYLLFATEHSACKVTGGIGAYVEQMEKLLPPEKFALCYVGAPQNLPADGVTDRRWILPSSFLERDEWERLSLADLTYRLLQVLAFLYPGLRTVEFQEYLGIGHLASRARRSGLLPEDLTIKTRCHGSQVYLESCFSKWTGIEHLEIAYQEKVSIEEADVVSFPSRFLLDLYRAKGYRIDEANVELRKYPFDFPTVPGARRHRDIDTLIFFGKRTRMKGFPSFVDALTRIAAHPSRHGIRRVLVVGRVDPALHEENRRLAELGTKIEVVEFAGTRAEVIALIQSHSDSALCVMPYESDNHPMAVLEAASTGCPIVAANAGGIPEMIPAAFHRWFLHRPGGDDLYEACVRIIELSPVERSRLVDECLAALGATYRAVNAGHLADGARTRRPVLRTTGRATVGVIVPCFHSKLEHIRDLVYGLNAQTLPADEVCFVNDGSGAGFSSELKGYLDAHLAAPFRIVDHDVNRGLAAARNTGLRNLKTDYVVNLDSDDIPRREFLRDYAYYLDHDPEAVAVTSWLESFYDGANWLDGVASSVIYKPLGDGLMLAQTQNCLGHANSGFRRDHLLSIGGWDDSDRTMWEDWALFLRIVCSGHRIGVVPRSQILYRVNPGSMVRTYAWFPAMNRLARNVPGLPTFEAHRLQGLMRDYAELRVKHEQLEESRSALSFKIARRTVEFMKRHPRVKAPVKKMFLLGEAVFSRTPRGRTTERS